MIFGFNTDIKVGRLVFHVQTEDRGAGNPTIDTTIYYKGRVLAKRAVSYKDFFESENFDPDDLKELVERHHKRWMAAVEKDELEEMKAVHAAENAPKKIKVTLLNPDTIFRTAFIAVSIGVTDETETSPVGQAKVRVRFKTESSDSTVTRTCGDDGRVDVHFPMPKIGVNGAELTIQVQAGKAKGELKYNLRPKEG